jgi:hypothetical protein
MLPDAPGQRIGHLEFMPAARAGDHPLFHGLYLINNWIKCSSDLNINRHSELNYITIKLFNIQVFLVEG